MSVVPGSPAWCWCSHAVPEPCMEKGLWIRPQQQGSTHMEVKTRVWPKGPCREGVRGRGGQASSSKCQQLICPLSRLSFPSV